MLLLFGILISAFAFDDGTVAELDGEISFGMASFRISIAKDHEKHSLYRIDITSADGEPPNHVWHGYKEFVDLRKDLVREVSTLPDFPKLKSKPMTAFQRFAAKFQSQNDLDCRDCRDLENWLQSVMLRSDSEGRGSDRLRIFLDIDDPEYAHESGIFMPASAYRFCDTTTHYFGIDVRRNKETIDHVWRRYSEFLDLKNEIGSIADQLKTKFPPKLWPPWPRENYNGSLRILAPRRRALLDWLREVKLHGRSRYAGDWREPLSKFLDPSTNQQCPVTTKTVLKDIAESYRTYAQSAGLAESLGRATESAFR